MQIRKLVKLLVAMTLAAGVLYMLGCKGRPEPADGGPHVIPMSVTQRGGPPTNPGG